MKKILTLIAAMAAFVACSKVDVTAPDAGIAQNREIKFNINVGGFGGPETKAVKTGWTSGDKINIWFNSNDYKTPDLVMTYDGSAWSYGELADTFEPETGQNFVAIYEGFNDLSKYDYRDGFYASPFTYVGYNFPMIVASKGTYEYSDDTITADLSKGWSFGTMLQVYISGLDKNVEYVLSCPSLRPLKSFGLVGGVFAFGRGTAGDVVTGVPYGDGVAFYFLDNYDKNGTAADYKFTLTQYSAAGSVVSKCSYTANGKTLTIDSKKCQGISIAAGKFTWLLKNHSATLIVGENVTLGITEGYPTDGLTWSSSNNDVATVDQTGKVTAVSEGSATITVTTVDGGLTATCSVTVVPVIALKGVFSVSTTRKVRFSRGNLQATYNGTDYTFGFAEHQYDYIGNAAGNTTINSQTSGAVVDFFGWSTDATNYGISTATSNSNYSGDFVDWGKNIGDGSTWRTLSKDEWIYLLMTRTNASSLYKYGVTVCDKTNCLIIAPDNWDTSANPLQDSYDATAWAIAEAAGLVCLPAAGYRDGSSIYSVGNNSYYWSSSADNGSRAYSVRFNSVKVYPSIWDYRHNGYSVRLITESN